MTQQIDKTIIINASPSTVWKALTDPDSIKQWMVEPGMAFEIITDWKVGNPITIKAFHHTPFENKGTVLQFESDSVLQYNYLSSLSRLPDKPENYSSIEFRLAPLENRTSFTLTLRNFPTETIFRHIDFYWRATIEVMKTWIEKQ
jgi:uncharacterized protein YndB with AHSA1/START domain